MLNTGCIALNPGTLEAIKLVTEVKTAVDGASTVSTGKTLTDHAISNVVDKDCNTFNLLKNKSFCYESTSVENKNYLIGTYEENYEWPVQSVRKNTLSRVAGVPVNKSINKGKQNERKLGSRHTRHAHKIRGKGSNPKVECKPSSGVFRIPDPFLARRTGRNETCSKNK